MAFKGLVKEAEADNDGELAQVLKEYETILGQNATNIVSYSPTIVSRQTLTLTACCETSRRPSQVDRKDV